MFKFEMRNNRDSDRNPSLIYYTVLIIQPSEWVIGWRLVDMDNDLSTADWLVSCCEEYPMRHQPLADEHEN